MKSFENNLKDRFKDASSLKGIDAEELWNNIEPVITDEGSSNTKPGFYWLKYLFLFLSLFVLIGVGVWYQSGTKTKLVAMEEHTGAEFSNRASSEEHSNTEHSNVGDLKPKDSSILQELESNSKEGINKTAEVVSENKTKKSNEITDEIISEDTIENVETTKPENIVLNDKQNANTIRTKREKQTKEEPKDEGFVENKIDPINEFGNIKINKALNQLENKKEVDLPTKDDFDKEVLMMERLDAVQEIESLPLLLLENEKDFDLNRTIKVLSLNGKRSRFTLGAFVGTHTIKNNFSSNSASSETRKDLLNDGYQLELGVSFALEGNFRLYKNIFFVSGLEYVQSKSEFNLIQTWDTTMVNPNSPVGAMTPAIATRTVKHHNRVRYLSVPILLGFQKSFGKIDLGTSVGVGLNFTNQQTGKALSYADEVALYPVDENELLPRPDFFIAYHLRPYVTINLNQKTSAQLRTDIRYQGFQNSEFYKLDFNSIFLGLGGGIQYRF